LKTLVLGNKIGANDYRKTVDENLKLENFFAIEAVLTGIFTITENFGT
jgi:hypothetical protein